MKRISPNLLGELYKTLLIMIHGVIPSTVPFLADEKNYCHPSMNQPNSLLQNWRRDKKSLGPYLDTYPQQCCYLRPGDTEDGENGNEKIEPYHCEGSSSVSATHIWAFRFQRMLHGICRAPKNGNRCNGDAFVCIASQLFALVICAFVIIFRLECSETAITCYVGLEHSKGGNCC